MKRLEKVFFAVGLSLLFWGCGSEEKMDALVRNAYPAAEILQTQGGIHDRKTYILCHNGAILSISVINTLLEYKIGYIMALNPQIAHCEMKQKEKE